MNWSQVPLLGFDTETTGINPLQDRIVTVALIQRNAGKDTERTWLINPGVPIPQQASDVHGITTEYAAAHGSDPGEVLAEVADLLVAHLKQQYPVVAFNAPYDLQIIESELARLGLPTLVSRLGRVPMPVVDPLVIDRGLVKFRRGKRRLGDLCAAYGVSERTDLHTAEVDVAATLDLLEIMTEVHTPLHALNLPQLHNWQVHAHAAWAVDVNKWLASKQADRPGASTEWPLPGHGDANLWHESPAEVD